MKIEEQVLSIEQMKHLQELGVDTSDASMCWLRYDVGGVVKQFVEINDIKDYEWSYATQYPTYTIGDLIEKLPKEIAFTFLCASYKYERNGFSSEVRYQLLHTHDSNLKEDLYNALCFVAENHKELLEERNEKECFT